MYKFKLFNLLNKIIIIFFKKKKGKKTNQKKVSSDIQICQEDNVLFVKNFSNKVGRVLYRKHNSGALAYLIGIVNKAMFSTFWYINTRFCGPI